MDRVLIQVAPRSGAPRIRLPGMADMQETFQEFSATKGGNRERRGKTADASAAGELFCASGKESFF